MQIYFSNTLYASNLVAYQTCCNLFFIFSSNVCFFVCLCFLCMSNNHVNYAYMLLKKGLHFLNMSEKAVIQAKRNLTAFSCGLYAALFQIIRTATSGGMAWTELNSEACPSMHVFGSWEAVSVFCSKLVPGWCLVVLRILRFFSVVWSIKEF